jgi:hypothetical protein
LHAFGDTLDTARLDSGAALVREHDRIETAEL